MWHVDVKGNANIRIKKKDLTTEIAKSASCFCFFNGKVPVPCDAAVFWLSKY